MSSVDQRSQASAAPPPEGPSVGAGSGRRGAGRTVVVVLLLVTAVVVLAEALSLVRDARQAESALQAFKSSLQSNDEPAAARHLRNADASLAAARHRYDSTPLRIMRHIPLLGWPVSDAGRLIAAAGDVSSAGRDALGLYDQVRGNGSKLFHDNTVSLPEVAVVSRDAERMVAKMDVAERRLAGMHAQFWEIGVGSARDKAMKQLRSLRSEGQTARTMLQLTPRLVGADGSRTYLIAVLNPAELQGAGGSALNMLCVRFVNGHMTILQSGSTFDLTNQNTPTRFAPLPDDPWMAGTDRQVLAAVDASPDFRTSGQELMRGYTAQFGVPLDGVVALDPLAMQQLMRQIPPFTTPGYGLMNADTIVPTVLVDSYAKYPDVGMRHRFNDELMTTLLHKVLGGGHMIGKGTALRDAATGGHLQVYVNDPTVQREVASAQLLRTLPAPRRGDDVVGVYTLNGNASKVDYWQRRTIEQHVTIGADGSARVVRTVEISNNAPPYTGPQPAPVSGYLTRILTLKFSTYLPASATVQSLTRDGVSVTPTRFTERGLLGLRLSRYAIPQGRTSTLTLTYTLPPGTVQHHRYVLDVAAQPTVQPVTLQVTVDGPGSCHAAFATADMRPGATTLHCR